ncbi:MAG: endo-1,4-beta-xylanase [Planctomycetota bacterium]
MLRSFVCLIASFFVFEIVSAEKVIEFRDPASMRAVGSQSATSKIVNDEFGDSAFRVDIEKAGEVPWAVVMHTGTNTKPLLKGDRLLCEISARVTGERTEYGNLRIATESAVKHKQGYAGDQIELTTKKKTYRFTVTCPGDYDAGEYRIALHLAQIPQVVDIYAVSMERYDADTPTSQLNISPISWRGQEEDAPWRIQAQKRIEEFRKQTLKIIITDDLGNPVPDAKLNIQQRKHAWRFGMFVGPTLLAENEDGRKYRELIKSRYNYLALPAYLANWGWLNEESRSRYFRFADWAQENKLPARGHLLVYPGWAVTPPEWFNIPKPDLRKNLEQHIPTAIDALRVRGVTEWDVTNELRMNEAFMDEIGGVQVAADWFKAARERLPSGDLYINETFILSNGGKTETEQAKYEEHIEQLLAAGAPIDGLGMQGHFGSQLTPPEKLIETLNRFARYGKKIQITEFDIDTDDKRAQALYMRDFYTACFSHPSVVGVVRWGFWEGEMWKPRGHAFTKEWQTTLVSEAYEDLVLGKWWTNLEGQTDANGIWKDRVFRGVQNISVDVKGYRYNRDLEVDSDAVTHEVILPIRTSTNTKSG